MPLKLLKGIRYFKNNAFLKNENLFSSLTEGQNPDTLFITCSDSRIIPSSITHSKYGDLFVIRNAGNIIPPSSQPSGEAATIEYALEVLNVTEIIICGHSQCGAMHGVLNPPPEGKLPAVAAWLSYAQPALEKAKEKYSNFAESTLLEKSVHTTQENILLQIENLKTHSAVKKKMENKQLTLQGWFYDIKSGEIFVYNQNSEQFVPFEEAVTEAFNGPLIQDMMQAIVEKEATKYLDTLISPETTECYIETKTLIDQVALKGVNPIWKHIQETVHAQLWSEFGDLCENVKNGVDERFTELLKKAQEAKLTHLKNIYLNLAQSPGYQKFCSQTIRNTSYAQAEQTPQGSAQHFIADFNH